MKKEHPIRTLLGLKQEDIAMLLGVSRAHWGMYEIGKRDLPLPAKQVLAELLAQVHSSEAIGKHMLTAQQDVRQQQFERLLRENEYQQLLLARKMADAKKKQTAEVRLSLLLDFLNSREAKDGKVGNKHQQSILGKAHQSLAADHAAILIHHELKIEVLQLEKLLIESKLQSGTS